MSDSASYIHDRIGLQPHHDYLLPAVLRALGLPNGRKVFEIGFGNGAIADQLHREGYQVAGIEPSMQGVALAHQLYPHLTALKAGSVYEIPPEHNGAYDIVISLEVVEHLYAPRQLVANARTLLRPNGLLVLSTPYHGYWKNLALALDGKFDRHFDPLWDHGHIKFWSIKTLRLLLHEGGFGDPRFIRVGRIPALAKSVIVLAQRSGEVADASTRL